jgi:hypothetical protein
LTLPDDIPIPPHAYVPGQTARHPEDWFDAIKADVGTGLPIEQTQAWRAGLLYLEQGYFWECHEVLEAVWMVLANPSAERNMTQAIIQLANGRLKLAMGKPRATLRLCGMVQDLLAGCHGAILGIEVDWLRHQCAATEHATTQE